MKRRDLSGFTLIELILVIAVIVILMGLVIGVSHMVSEKAKRDVATSTIVALATSMERYKADNGVFPMGPGGETDVDPKAEANHPAAASSLFLYKELSGDSDASFSRADSAGERANTVYFEFEDKKHLIKKAASQQPGQSGYVLGIADPWGNCYGYSTLQARQLQDGTPNPPTGGYNPTFDLWSTANAPDNRERWIANW